MPCQCSICIADICFQTSDAEPIASAPCGHLFHQSCLEAWITRSKAECPHCRRKVSVSNLVVLYPDFRKSSDGATNEDARVDTDHFYQKYVDLQAQHKAAQGDIAKLTDSLTDAQRNALQNQQATGKLQRDKAMLKEQLKTIGYRLSLSEERAGQVSKLREELGKAERVATRVQRIRVAMEGSADDIDELFDVGTPESRANAVIIASMRTQLKTVERQMNDVNSQLIEAKGTITRLRESEDLRDDQVKSLESQLSYEREKTARLAVHLEDNTPNRNHVKRLKMEHPAPRLSLKFDDNSFPPCDAAPLDEEVTTVVTSSSSGTTREIVGAHQSISRVKRHAMAPNKRSTLKSAKPAAPLRVHKKHAVAAMFPTTSPPIKQAVQSGGNGNCRPLRLPGLPSIDRKRQSLQKHKSALMERTSDWKTLKSEFSNNLWSENGANQSNDFSDSGDEITVIPAPSAIGNRFSEQREPQLKSRVGGRHRGHGSS